MALQADGKIVAVGIAGGNGSSFALARYNPNGSLDTTFSGDGKQTTDFGGYFDGADGGGDPGRWQDRRGRPRGRRERRLRARPLQPERLARHDLLRRRQADDRLRRRRRGARGGDPGRRQDRRGRRRVRRRPATSPSPATTRTARSTRASPATASRPPTSGASTMGDRGGAPGGRQDRRRSAQPAVGVCGDFALARYNPNGTLDTSFSGDGKQTTKLGDAAEGRPAWRSKATARSSQSVPGAPTSGTSPSPATTRTAPSTPASPATASRRPTSGVPTRRTRWRSRVARLCSSAVAAWWNRRQRLRPRPLQTERLARHELLRRRQADDRLRQRRCGEWGGAPGRRQDRRGWPRRGRWRLRLRARPLQRQRRARHKLLRRRQADDRLRVSDQIGGASGVALQGDGKIVAVGVGTGPTQTDDFALARYQVERLTCRWTERL